MNPQPSFKSRGSDHPRQVDATAKRRLRGMEIAATVQIGKNTAGYIVPSKSGNRFYLVKLDDTPSCTCPDFELRRQPCKHIWAVWFVIQREESPKEKPKARSPVPYRDWSAYNNGHFEEGRQFPTILRALCDTVPQPPQTTGRPRLPLGDMVYVAALKTYTCLSGRRAMSGIADAHDNGHLRQAPSVASVYRYLENPNLTPMLEQLIARSALPLRDVETNFAIDASGFSSSEKDNWLESISGGTKLGMAGGSRGTSAAAWKRTLSPPPLRPQVTLTTTHSSNRSWRQPRRTFASTAFRRTRPIWARIIF